MQIFSVTYKYRIVDPCGNERTCEMTHSGSQVLTGEISTTVDGLTCIDQVPDPDPDAIAAEFDNGCGGTITVYLYHNSCYRSPLSWFSP